MRNYTTDQIRPVLNEMADPFDAPLPLQATAAQDWVRLLLMVHRQLACPDTLMRHSVVLDPLVDSLIHGLLLVADHPYRDALAAPAAPGRPAAGAEGPGPSGHRR